MAVEYAEEEAQEMLVEKAAEPGEARAQGAAALSVAEAAPDLGSAATNGAVAMEASPGGSAPVADPERTERRGSMTLLHPAFKGVAPGRSLDRHPAGTPQALTLALALTLTLTLTLTLGVWCGWADSPP